MNHFRYVRSRLCCEGVRLADIADKVGTPAYVYSQSAIENRFREFDRAFAPLPHLVCYAVKANSNLAVLSLLRALGAGFDIVSGGELRRVLTAGARPGRIVFSGVGKTLEEVDLGLSHGILQFNLESEAELDLLAARAAHLRKEARVGVRVNPDVDAETHPYHSTGLSEHKFGISCRLASEVLQKASHMRRLTVTGIGFHIGSQITRLEPFLSALERLRALALELKGRGIDLRHLDLGGGLGIVYTDEKPPDVSAYGRALIDLVKDLGCGILLEPGRAIVGNAGLLLTRVIRIKNSDGKSFVVVDAAMNDLIRPSLYGAQHRIRHEKRAGRETRVVDVVGPVCETGDFLARDRQLPAARAGDLLAVMSAGAYGFVSSSNYNSRTRPAEVLVRGSRFKVIRRRETFEDLIRGEMRRPL